MSWQGSHTILARRGAKISTQGDCRSLPGGILALGTPRPSICQGWISSGS